MRPSPPIKLAIQQARRRNRWYRIVCLHFQDVHLGANLAQSVSVGHVPLSA